MLLDKVLERVINMILHNISPPNTYQNMPALKTSTKSFDILGMLPAGMGEPFYAHSRQKHTVCFGELPA